MMRVLFFQHAVGAGGSAVSLRYLTGGLAQRGHEIHVAIHDAAAGMRTFYETAGVRVHKLPSLPSVLHTTAAHVSLLRPRSVLATARMIARYPAARGELLRLVDHVSPDIVHLNSATLAPTAFALRARSVPVVWHVRESPPFGPRGLRTAALRNAMRRYAAEMIFISGHDRRMWADNRFGTVIYNCATAPPAGSDEAGLAVRQQLGLESDAPIVLFLGGLQEIKGIAPLLMAIPAITRAVPSARLVILGADVAPPSSRVAAVARSLTEAVRMEPFHLRMRRTLADPTIASRVRILPSVDGISDYLAACDLVVFPSIRPHFARPVIEAALASKPVVASRLGGVEEVVDHERTGLLVTPGDSGELAAAVVRILDDRQAALRLGIAGRESAADRFSVQRHVDSVVGVYDRVRL